MTPDQLTARMRSMIAELITAAHRFNIGEPKAALDSLRSGWAQLGAISADAERQWGTGFEQRRKRK